MSRRNELQVFLRGGLGNQLFQYSTGLAIAEKTGRELIIRGDLLPEIEDSIGGVSRWPNQISSFNHSGVVRTNSFQPASKTNLLGKSMQAMRALGDAFPSVSRSLGWLASEKTLNTNHPRVDSTRLINSYSPYKYLAWSNRARLRNELSSIVDPTDRFIELSAEINRTPTIAIHLRQGDYLRLQHIFGKPSINYFRAALEYLESSSVSHRVWLFTDSPDSTPPELLNLLNPALVIGPEVLSKPIENLVLMGSGSGLVAANSSFSWWANLISEEGVPVVAPRISGAIVSNFEVGNEPNQKLEFLDA